MSSNAAHQSNINAQVDEPPHYDKDRTVEGAPMKASELAKKCKSQTGGHDVVGGGTQVTSNENSSNRK
jgi:hypothetical protein